jgi:hypothetical protein
LLGGIHFYKLSDCLELVHSLEQTYGIEVYWPWRSDNHLCTSYCDAVGCTGASPTRTRSDGTIETGYNTQFEPWRLREVRTIETALEIYEKEFGPALNYFFMSQVAFVRGDKAAFSILPNNKSTAAQYMGLWTTLHNRYVIILYDAGASEEWFFSKEDVLDYLIHELAHHLSHYVRAGGLMTQYGDVLFRDEIWGAGVTYNPGTGPTEYASTPQLFDGQDWSYREDFAESVKIYLQNKHGTIWRPLSSDRKEYLDKFFENLREGFVHG